MRPRLLDLFCGAGGAAMGYHRAGFEVVGIDVKPQPHYPFEFHQADATTFLEDDIFPDLYGYFDVIHASPPCQAYSHGTWQATKERSPELIDTMRTQLEDQSRPWVMENVMGASHALRAGLLLCGSMFDLAVERHRLFESSEYFWAPTHDCRRTVEARKQHPYPAHWGKADWRAYGVTGHSRGRGTVEFWRELMDMPWAANAHELTEAIPPAYTEWIGNQLIAAIAAKAA
jgi:DNA (cytosine-5)-methyltransferase 1